MVLGVVVAYVGVSAVASAVVASELDRLKGLPEISRARISIQTTQDRINLVVVIVSVWITIPVTTVGAIELAQCLFDGTRSSLLRFVPSSRGRDCYIFVCFISMYYALQVSTYIYI